MARQWYPRPAEQLADSYLNRVSLPDMLFQFLQIAAYAIAIGIVFVDRPPAVADQTDRYTPYVIGLALI